MTSHWILKIARNRHVSLGLRHKSSHSSSLLHPPWEERVAMVNEAVQMLQRLESHPPLLAGSGHKWIAQSDSRLSPSDQSVLSTLKANMVIKERPSEEKLDKILKDIVEPASRLSTDDTAPGYMAYIPSGGMFHSAVASLIGSSLNRYVTINEAAPALAAIEWECIHWLCREVIGWGDKTADQCGGVLTSGGSFANVLAIHMACRNAIDNSQLPKATLYTSEQAHYCISQAARFIGIQPKNVRSIRSDNLTMKMDTGALEHSIGEDLAAGLIPIAVCATAGTTNTGSCDNLADCASICAEYDDIWLHVDAAYGGAYALTKKGSAALGPLNVADSVVIDPHKGLFMPYGIGALLVRDQRKLLKSNKEDGACMQPPNEAANDVDIMNLSPELSRDFRGLRMWLPLKILGTSTFRDELNKNMSLASMAAKTIKESGIPGLRVVIPPELSIFTFKLDAPPGIELSGEELDALNIEFLHEIHKKGNALLSPMRSISNIPGEVTIRMAINSHRTDEVAVKTALKDVISAAELVRPKIQTNPIYPSAKIEMLPDRSNSIDSALQDPVSDYRRLANLPLWSNLLQGHSKDSNFRAIDICCGTGRWFQAFSEIVLPKFQPEDKVARIQGAMDFVDICTDSLAILEQRRSLRQTNDQLGLGGVFRADACVLPENQEDAYDLVTNMHGLYAFSGRTVATNNNESDSEILLQSVVKRMIQSLKPGGTLVIAISHKDSPEKPSFYDRVGKELAELGVIDQPNICAEDVMNAFASLGFPCEKTKDGIGELPEHSTQSKLILQTLEYNEVIQSHDFSALHRYVLEESGANCFPASFVGGNKLEPNEVEDYFLSLVKNENYDEESGSYSFNQRAGVLVFQKASLLPDIVSNHIENGSFYNDAYDARTAASTLQSNAKAWLAKNADSILPFQKRTQKILSIGCGCGELELALLDNCSKDLSVDFVGFEPNDDMREKFAKNIYERDRLFRMKKQFNLLDSVFCAKSKNSNLVGPFDLVIMGHVLYYFDNTAEIIEEIRKLTRSDGGKVLVVHQAAQGIPEIQYKLLPLLREHAPHILTSNDITSILPTGSPEIQVIEVPALMDLKEIHAGSEVGKQIMSFALEVDLRKASESLLNHCRRSFMEADSVVEHDVHGIGPSGSDGPFLKEPATLIMFSGLAN